MQWLLGLGLLLGLLAFLAVSALASFRRSVRQLVRDALREQLPGAQVVRETARALELRFPDGTSGTLGLANLYTGIASGPRDEAARRGAVSAFVNGALSGLLEANKPLSLSAHGERLMPRLAEAAFASDAASQGKPLVQRPTAVPGLVTLYVLDSEEAVMYLGEERLAELGIDAEALHARAMANLGRRSIAEIVRGVVERKQVATVEIGDTFDATRLLLVPDALREGEELVAVVPDRETLGLLPVPADEAWTPVRKLARSPASPYRLIAQPLRVTRSGFEIA